MIKTNEIFDTMIRELYSTENPSFVMGAIGEKLSESYELQYVAGKIHVKADNPFGAIIGRKRAMAALDTGYIRENLGRNTPQFSIRAFQAGKIDLKAALMQGYNTVVCETREEWDQYRNSGLKIIFKLIEKDEDLDCDSLFAIWVSSTLKEVDETKTRFEMIREDLQQWEQWVDQRCQLIYQLSHGMDDTWICWFLELCVLAKLGTTLAFPVSCPPKLWEKLRQTLDVIHTPLLVILNQEQELKEELVGHNFCGGISLNTNPKFLFN